MSAAHTVASTAEEGPPSILIVEDDGIIGRNIQQSLASFGYDAYAVATSSEEAIAYAAERCPDLVLLDIRIKGKLDGIETAAILRERFGVPVLYLTAYSDTATVARAKKTEPLGYLVKPVKQAELRSAVEISLYRDAMDRRLRQRERWFSTTLRSIADAVVTVDLGGRITFMNPAAEVLTGLSFDEARGRLAREVVPLSATAGASGELNPLEQALRERRRVQIDEAKLGRDRDTIRLVSDSAAPVEEDGKLLGAVMVFRDVTEQQRLRRQVEVADRLVSLGTMAAGVAHEVNNPLSVVVGNADIVRELLDQTVATLATAHREEPPTATLEDARLALEDLRSAASRISRIVRDLQTFARPNPVSSETADVTEAVTWAVRSTSYELRHRARVEAELSSTPRVAIDETKLGQVLVNLLMNAAQAIAPGNVAGNQVSVRTRAEGTTVTIEVRDTGSGIPSDALAHVFDPFYTTKPVGAGTGLGLSICHGIVSSYGGSIEVESEEGSGALFRVTLPAAKIEQPAPSEPRPAIPERVGRLLAIDDEELMLQVLRRALKAHTVVSTTSAREALERLARGEEYDIIFCDIMMPEMTGVAFFEELLRSAPEAARRVIFMTGGALTVKVEDFLASVPNRRLDKPFNLLALRELVSELLASAAARGERA
jgi:PAS domain S-box-containing protein